MLLLTQYDLQLEVNQRHLDLQTQVPRALLENVGLLLI